MPDDLNPYQPPSANIVPDRALTAPQHYPGIKRLAFFGSVFLIILISRIITEYTHTSWALAIMFLNIVPMFFRLKNIGWHPLWCTASVVPCLGLFVILPCFSLPAGYQQHRQIDIPAMLTFVLSLVVIVLISISSEPAPPPPPPPPLSFTPEYSAASTRLSPAMKLILLSLLLLPSLLLAQNAARPLMPPPQPQQIGYPVPNPSNLPATLPDNYQITLILSEKDSDPLEITLTVASRTFSAVLADSNLSFSGDLTLEDSGAVLVNYNLGWDTPTAAKGGQPGLPAMQYMSSRTQGSVRLKVGEEIPIIRAGTRTAKLTIQKLPLAKAK